LLFMGAWHVQHDALAIQSKAELMCRQQAAAGNGLATPATTQRLHDMLQPVPAAGGMMA
jgi:hypothetical protein